MAAGKRWIWFAGLGAAAIVLAGAAWSQRDTLAFAQMATGYAAKETCSCRHVSGRTMDSCMQDLPEEARGQVDIRETGDRVKASVILGAISAEARFDGEYGCTLLN